VKLKLRSNLNQIKPASAKPALEDNIVFCPSRFVYERRVLIKFIDD
jgi:hypothetical protein